MVVEVTSHDVGRKQDGLAPVKSTEEEIGRSKIR